MRVTDDDLDLDLDVEPTKPAKPAAEPKAESEPKAKSAKALGTPKPSLLTRASNYVKRPQWNGRTFLAILIALVLIVALAENFTMERFYFFGFAFELPKALAFLIDVAIGALLMRWWLRRPSAGAGGEQ